MTLSSEMQNWKLFVRNIVSQICCDIYSYLLFSLYKIVAWHNWEYEADKGSKHYYAVGKYHDTVVFV